MRQLNNWNKLDKFKSAALAEVPPRALQALARAISDSLVIMRESSPRTEEIPEEGRRANTAPVFKEGEERLRELYSSLTCSAEK